MFRNPFSKSGRPVIAAMLAATLALTSVTATPARAGGEDKVGAIAAASFFALITAGIIAGAASQHRDDKALPAPRGSRHGWGDRRDDRRKVLPAQCEFTVRHGRDAGTYYDSHCLKRSFNYWPYLPDRCEERVDLRGSRDRNAYDARCLARYGYREEAWPRSGRR